MKNIFLIFCGVYDVINLSIFYDVIFVERRYAVAMNQLLHLDIVNVCFLRFTHLISP